MRRVASRSLGVALAATDRVRGFLTAQRAFPGDGPSERAIAWREQEFTERASANPTLSSHLGGLVDKRLRQLAECSQFVSAADPVEAIHELRTASRRLRAFTDVLRPLTDDEIHGRADVALRRLTRSARALRDCDVQMGLLEEWLARATTPAERAALEHLLERSDLVRREVRRRTKKRLKRVDFDELHVSVCAALGETIAHLPGPGAATLRLVRGSLEPLVAAAAKSAPPDDGVEHVEAMHELRLALKRLRYALELFEPVLGPGYGALHDRARLLQDLLGGHHDLVVMAELLDGIRLELEQRNRGVLLSGIRALQADLAAERQSLLARFRATGFDREWWREGLRGAIDEPPPV